MKLYKTKINLTAAIFLILFFSTISSCKKKDDNNEPSVISPIVFTDQYSISESKIYKYNNPIQLIGANALHVFSAGSADMKLWNIDIVREFVGNMKEQPLVGFPILSTTGAYLHSLQAIVDSNRKDNRITIICPFGWDGTAATEYTGKRPAQTVWWQNHTIKLAQWASYFKDQKDVWIEVWNEPYKWDRTDGYTDDIWMNDMNDMVNTIRNAGNNNIILIPCAEQGQDESVLLNKGNAFLNGKKNILFDIHAYEKWLLVSNNVMGARLQNLQTKKLPVFFGESAPLNAGVLMDTRPFLDSLYNRGISISAWLWKYSSTDKDALLDNNGLPNNNSNNNWGSAFKALLSKPRNP
jgi:mannan endo-1,4-beta-mannosidase